MGRHSCCTKQKLRKGLWSPEEDEKLFNYITKFGVGCWSSVPNLAGLQRCGKSCRLRWINYLRPDLKRGMFCQEEENLIIDLHKVLGNRWAQIASHLAGRTDNEIKNLWNSSLKKKLKKQGIDPTTHLPLQDHHQEDSETRKHDDVVSSTHIPPHCIHGLLPPPIMAVKSEQSIFMDSSALPNNDDQSLDFESSLGPTAYSWAQDMSRVYGPGLRCPETGFSGPSVIPRVDSFSVYNTSNEGRESSSYSSMNSTGSGFSSYIPGNYNSKLEGFFYDYDCDDEQYNNKINGGERSLVVEDRKLANPWLMMELGSSNFADFQQL